MGQKKREGQYRRQAERHARTRREEEEAALAADMHAYYGYNYSKLKRDREWGPITWSIDRLLKEPDSKYRAVYLKYYGEDEDDNGYDCD